MIEILIGFSGACLLTLILIAIILGGNELEGNRLKNRCLGITCSILCIIFLAGMAGGIFKWYCLLDRYLYIKNYFIRARKIYEFS